MELVKLLRGVVLSDHPLQLKQALFKRLVDIGIVNDIPDYKLESICAFALSLSLSNNGDKQEQELLSIVLAGIVERKTEFFDRYFGHEVIIDLMNRAMLPSKSSSSTSLSSSNDSNSSRPRSQFSVDDDKNKGSVSSSVAPSPMSTSDPPTPSTMPPSPTNSTSSSQASFGSLCPTSQRRNHGSDEADDGAAASTPISVDWTSKFLETVGDAASSSSDAASSSSTPGPMEEDPSISGSITRQRGICRETAPLSPSALLDVLDVCLRVMTTKISGNNMVRRYKVIAAHMAKLLKAHDSTLDVAVSLAQFQEAHPECTPIGEAADIMCRTLVDVLSGARPAKSQIQGVRRFEFNVSKFIQDVTIVAKFLERLWTDAGNNPDVASEDATPPLLATVMQETFVKLMSPRVPRDGASGCRIRPVGEPFLSLAAVLELIPMNSRDLAAHELATDCKIASNAQLQSLLKRMCEWILLLPMTNLTPTVATWVDIIVDRLAAEWRFTPLISICESEAGNLWKTAMWGKKRLVVRKSALRILSRLLLGYQHGPTVYFGQISYDFVSSLPELISDPGSAPLLPAVAKLLYGLLRLHGLPQTFTHNSHVYSYLRKLPPVDAVELETYLHQVQWNAKRLPHGWVGLLNLGNTCFANSALQALRCCTEFTRDVLALEPPPSKITSSHFTCSSNKSNGGVVNRYNNNNNKLKELEDARTKERNDQILIKLQVVLADLVFSQKPVFSPKDFMEISRPSYFPRGAQQDCVEYLDHLLNALNEKEKADQEPPPKDSSEPGGAERTEDEMRRNDQRPPMREEKKKPERVDLRSTTVWRNFGIRMETRHTCHVCGNQTVKEDPHTNIPLPFADEERQSRQRQRVLAQDAKEKEEAAQKQLQERREVSLGGGAGSGGDSDGGRPAKVLCGEGNSVRLSRKGEEEEEVHRDASESPTSCYHSEKSGLERGEIGDVFGEGGGGDATNTAAHAAANGMRLQRPRTPRKGFSPMTPASSPSPSPPPAVAFANDVIPEEDEDEDESSPLMGKDPYLGSSSDDSLTFEFGRREKDNPPPVIALADNDDDMWNHSIPASASGAAVSNVGAAGVTVEPLANAELGSDFFDPLALSEKLERLRRGDPLREDRWEEMESTTENDDDNEGVKMDVDGEEKPTFREPLAPHLNPPPLVPLKAISTTAPTASTAETETASSPALAAKKTSLLPASTSAAPEWKKPESFHLQNLLKCYLSTEIMHGDNAYFCERCDKRQTASRKACIKETSDYLILSLMRFEYNAGGRRKLNDPVVIPQELSVPLCFDDDDDDVTAAPGGCSDQRTRRDVALEIGPASPPPSPSSPIVEVPYRLLAVVVHSSETSDSGHYFTYVRTRPENNTVVAPSQSGWVLFNDTFAKEAPIATMEALLRTKLRDDGTPLADLSSRDTPYVLFYERVKSPSSMDANKIDLRVVAPSLRQGTRDLLTMNNRNWLLEKESSKGGGGNVNNSSAPPVKKDSWKPPDDDDDRKDGGPGGGAGGPCGGSGFGSFGNGPRFVY